jgi:hypothetical protein
VEVIEEMDEYDLKEYIPIKGDRLAVKAYARTLNREGNGNSDSIDVTTKRKLASLQTIGKRLRLNTSPDSESETKNRSANRWKQTQLRGKAASKKQTQNASKKKCSIIVGFCMYDSNGAVYRQV